MSTNMNPVGSTAIPPSVPPQSDSNSLSDTTDVHGVPHALQRADEPEEYLDNDHTFDDSGLASHIMWL